MLIIAFFKNIFTKRVRIANFIRRYALSSNRANYYKRQLINNARKIEEFEKHIGRKLYSNDFDELMFENYIHFLKSSPKNYKSNTIRGFAHKLAEFLRKAKKYGYKVDFGFEDVKLPKEETYTIALTEDELMKIYHCKNLSDEQNVARDWFLFNCYTGLRWCDLKRVVRANIKDNILTIRTQKTNIKVDIPLHWLVREIVEKHNGTLPKLKSQQAYGKILKRICKKAGINGVELVERHEGVDFVRKTFERWQMVSAHTARRTFATNAYLAGIPVARIMKLTGHKSESSFFKYIKIDNKQNAEFLSNHSFFRR